MIAGMNVQQKLDTGIPVLFYLSKIYVRQIHQGRMLIARLRFYFFSPEPEEAFVAPQCGHDFAVSCISLPHPRQ